MRGHIRQRGRSYEVRLRHGRTLGSGKPRVRTKTVATWEAAEQLLAMWLQLEYRPGMFTALAPGERNPPRPRWPLGPLREVAPTIATAELARMAGVSRRTAARWAETGLADVHADRVAVRLGLHPALVWPGWLDEGADVRGASVA